MITLEGKAGYYFGAAARVIDDARELAWAEKYVRRQPDVKWILGNFVEADHHNRNGHFFPFEDLVTAQDSIDMKPLNMGHHEHAIVGCFAGHELIKPSGEAAGAGVDHTHIEALSAFWHAYFPKLYDEVILPAHKEGSLFYSMECTPSTVTCMGGPGGHVADCGREFAYDGPRSTTYCDHLNEPGAFKRLNKPHFTAGAIIVPPQRPGWAHASITEMAGLDRLIEQNLQEANRMYDAVKQEFPHLEPRQWEQMMAQIVAGEDLALPVPRREGAANTMPDRPATSMPDGTYLIIDEGSLRTAISKATPEGIAGADEEAREFILRRADQLGLMGLSGPAGDTLRSWKALYPDYMAEGEDCEMARLFAGAGFGLHDDYDLEYEIDRDFTQTRRMDLAKKGLAMPDGSYPIVTIGDLKNAVMAAGRAAAGKADAVKAWVKKRAASLGATSLLPAGW